MGRPRSDHKDFEDFFKSLFSLWINSQKAIQTDKIVVSDQNYRECIKSEWDQAKNDQDGSLSYININNREVQVVISNDNYLIIKLEKTVFLAICVVQELGNYVLKITGLDFTNKSQEGLKTEYLIKLIEKIGCSISTVDKVNRLRRHLFAPLKREQIFIQNEIPGGKNQYFYFTFKLKEDLRTEDSIVKNVDDYMNILKRDGVVVYDGLQNPSSTDGYVEHFNAETQAKNLDTIETKCKKEIEKGNHFIRIKGSTGMGKSEILEQLVRHCQSKKYLTIKIDFRGIEKSIFNDLKSFSTLFSNLVMREIITLNNLNEDQFIDYKTNFNPDSVNYSTTEYFKNQILTFINNQNKLILAMDNVDKLFTSKIIRDAICPLWRSWYSSDNLIRQKMVMIITHSTDDYPDYNINSSPLEGIGYVPVLTDWEQPQIKQICQQYQLNLTDLAIKQLISQIGGHPYLVKLAINYLHEKQTTVENLLEIRLQEEFSPFCDYLDQILQHLQSLPTVCQIYAKILNGETITLKNINDKFHLKSMGLIKFNGGQISPKYPIYQDYFLPRI